MKLVSETPAETPATTVAEPLPRQTDLPQRSCAGCHEVWPSHLLFTVGERQLCSRCKNRAEEEHESAKIKRHGSGLGAPNYGKWITLFTVAAILLYIAINVYVSRGTRTMVAVVDKKNDPNPEYDLPLPKTAAPPAPAEASEPEPAEPAVELPPEPWAALPAEEWPQIMLSNFAELHRREPIEGASGVLVRGESGALYGVTVSHLLAALAPNGRDVAPGTLKTYLKTWTFLRRDNAQATVTFSGVHEELFRPAFLGLDLLVLTKPDKIEELPARPLRIEMVRVRPGDAAFIIGVPYASTDQRQQVFACTVKAVGNDSLGLSMPDKFEPNGFSGAPIVNQHGRLIGLVRSGTIIEDEPSISAVSARRFVGLIK